MSSFTYGPFSRMSFAFPSLLWFLPLVGVPVLIHLINMLRHRRVKWAAMEFLLQSQKRNRTWVMLKQLLLLLLRMLAVAAWCLMVAQPQARNTLGALLGGRRRTTSCSWTTAIRCPTIGPTPSAFKQADELSSRLGRQLRGKGASRNSRCSPFRRPPIAARA